MQATPCHFLGRLAHVQQEKANKPASLTVFFFLIATERCDCIKEGEVSGGVKLRQVK